jgi:predicted GIY-YIG superfamily endonuclease
MMRWYYYISYFFGGAFLANAIPHFYTGFTEDLEARLGHLKPGSNHAFANRHLW